MKYEIELNGRKYEIEVEVCEAMSLQEFSAYAPAPVAAPEVAPVEAAAPAEPTAPVVTGGGEIIESPMPGNILKVNVTAGQAVKEGTVLVILEAMKMENEILAPRDGTVTQVAVTKGATVETGSLLVVLN